MRKIINLALFIVASCCCVSAQVGKFQLGDLPAINTQEFKGKTNYSIKPGKGNIQVTVQSLRDTKGVIIEVFPENIPDNIELIWSFDGGTKDNVFSIEGHAFTLYYGESMALRAIQGCVSPESKLQISNSQSLIGRLPVKSGQKHYLCFYVQNAKADYNYFMLADLFNKGTATQQPLLAPSATQPPFSTWKGEGNKINVRDFGAKGDGKTIDSYDINAAIKAAAAQGGGTIYFPPGNYLSYSIRLKSHIRLFLDAGAKIIAAFPSATEGYDEAEPNTEYDDRLQDFGHSHWKNSLLWAIGEDEITICGSGTIDGMGLTREESRLKGVGNKAISLKECKNITLQDIRMLHCGHFALLATGVDNMTLNNLMIDTNRDGLDIDACRNVRISNCTVNSPWDDAIVLKASYGLGYFKDTENVTITNCFVSGYDQGSVANGTYQSTQPQAPDHGFNCGRIKFGTESSGGFKNIAISNCVFEHCRGLALETVDGGDLEDITISNITMRDIVNAPLFLRLGARMRSPEGTPVGKMRRILIDNINVFNADSRYASIISGIPGHIIEDVTLSNIHIRYKGGYSKDEAKLVPPESEKIYPEPWMFGTIPASAFYIRHARNIRFHQVYVDFMKEDARPAFVLDDAENIDVKETNLPLPNTTILPDWVQTVGTQTQPSAKYSVNANNFGAVGNGITLNTSAIQKAIDACAKKGGGRVELSPGTYLTGALYLKSNVELHLAKGVTLKAVNRVEDFPDMPTRVAGIEMVWPAAIINVMNQQNVAITGEGVIDGDGKYLWDKYWEMRKDYDTKGLRWIVDYDCKRVRSLLVSESKDVTISGLTFLRAGFWTIQLLYSSYCSVDGITIQNNLGGHGPSTDGIDIDSSHHIRIEGCDIDCNDDNICLKAGRDADGLRVNRPTEYVFIRNCITRKGAGLMTCGSETSGDIRHIYCTESKAIGTSAALRIKSAMTRGGTVEHIYMNNVQTDSVKHILNCDMNWNPSYSYSTLPDEYQGQILPKHWSVMLQQVSPEQGLPHFRNIYLSNIQARNTDTFINCIGTDRSIIQNVEVKDCYVEAKHYGTIQFAENVQTINNNILIK
jgi:polygalacturonase